MIDRVLFSKKSDDWETPKAFYEELNKEFSFIDDPCPVGAFDGLDRAWGEIVFVNPPYSNIKAFLKKAISEINLNNSKIVVFLVPARTDTKWFHNQVLPFCDEIRFIKGRLKFGNSKNSAPFPSLIIIFKNRNI